MEIWIPLIAAVIGGLIATIPSIINNRAQAKEREKERGEQRREDKVRAKEKWMERDILSMMDVMEHIAKLDVESMALKERLTSLLEDANDKPPESNLIEYREKVDKIYLESQQSLERLNTLGFSLEDNEVLEKVTKYLVVRSSYQTAKTEEDKMLNWVLSGQAAGALHHALRNKLISIRDS